MIFADVSRLCGTLCWFHNLYRTSVAGAYMVLVQQDSMEAYTEVVACMHLQYQAFSTTHKCLRQDACTQARHMARTLHARILALTGNALIVFGHIGFPLDLQQGKAICYCLKAMICIPAYSSTVHLLIVQRYANAKRHP